MEASTVLSYFLSILYNQVLTTIPIVHVMGDAIPVAKAHYSLDCFNVPESSCANK